MKAGLSISVLALIYNVSATDLRSLARNKSAHLLRHRSNGKMFDESQAWNNFFQKSGQEAVQIQETQNAYFDKLDKQEEDDNSFEFVQLKNQLRTKAASRDHDNDTEDMPENLEPIGFYATMKEIDQEKQTLQQAQQSQKKKTKDAHDHDTEDVPEQPEPLEVYNRPNWFAQKSKKSKDGAHDHDTEDVPEQPEPLEVYNKPSWFVQTGSNVRTNFNHENDSDDLPNDPFIDKNLNYVEPPTETNVQIHFNHENDTEDLPNDPFIDPNLNYVEPPTEMIQLKLKHKWNHENDTDDIPTGQDPVMIQLKHKKHSHHQHLPRNNRLVQIDDISHENDTDDVGYEPKVSNAYESTDMHHTKEWNDAVNRKALEIENQLQTEAEEEDARRQARREQQAEQEEQRKIALQQQEQKAAYQKAMQDGHQHLSQTDSSVYGFFENDINAGATNAKTYEHHSKYWEQMVEKQTQNLGQQMEKDDEEPSKKTVDLSEVYDKMNVQTGYEHHSKFWNEQVRAEEEKLAKQFKLEEEAEALSKQGKNNQSILAQGMTPVDTYVHHPNPSVDFEEMYGGVSLVQLGDHQNDEDDIVPELNETVKAPQALAQKEKATKKDFAGQSYDEIYDD